MISTPTDVNIDAVVLMTSVTDTISHTADTWPAVRNVLKDMTISLV